MHGVFLETPNFSFGSKAAEVREPLKWQPPSLCCSCPQTRMKGDMKNCQVALRRGDVCGEGSGQCERRPVGFWGGDMPCFGTMAWNGWPAVGAPVPDTRLWQYYCYCSLTVVTGIGNSHAEEAMEESIWRSCGCIHIKSLRSCCGVFFHCCCW